jgi:hypothetical protein
MAVKRYDSYEPAKWMTTPFQRTTEGFLTGRAIVTSIGVFTYKYDDGTVSRELRTPLEVFDRDSLDSMKLKPVCNDHPKELVTPDNTKELAVGNLGSNVTTTDQELDWSGRMTPSNQLSDGLHVAIDMTINRADAIEDVLNGKRALSMGYECELDESPGVWCGMEYDRIQRKIRYNHCAIVDAARAGDAAQIHLDSADAVLEINQSHEEEKSMKTIKIDGVDYQGDETLVAKYAELVKRADAADEALKKERESGKTALDKMEADRDTQKDRADAAEAEAKRLKEDALDPKRLDEAVAEKCALLDAADAAGVEVKNDMADTDIKKAVIMAAFPNAKLDGKDESYIKARYESAIEMLEAKADGTSRVVAGENPQGESRMDAAAARQRMIDYNNRRSRGEKTEA